MAHRIDGRKLSRKQGPRIALYRNLAVSVLRYEQIRTTEAQGQGDPRPGRAAASRSPRSATSTRAGA